METILRDRPFYERSGGGVTFSGGEPFLRRDLEDLCLSAYRRCRPAMLWCRLLVDS